MGSKIKLFKFFTMFTHFDRLELSFNLSRSDNRYSKSFTISKKSESAELQMTTNNNLQGFLQNR